jgi:uncharacterized protein YdiU (UPF0061 family)
MRAKLGLAREEPEDMELAVGLLAVLETQGADFTRVFRSLSAAVSGEACCKPRSLFDNPAGFDVWLPLWQARLEREDRTPMRKPDCRHEPGQSGLYPAQSHGRGSTRIGHQG